MGWSELLGKGGGFQYMKLTNSQVAMVEEFIELNDLPFEINQSADDTYDVTFDPNAGIEPGTIEFAQALVDIGMMLNNYRGDEFVFTPGIIHESTGGFEGYWFFSMKLVDLNNDDLTEDERAIFEADEENYIWPFRGTITVTCTDCSGEYKNEGNLIRKWVYSYDNIQLNTLFDDTI
jgi:hypothetical protein